MLSGRAFRAGQPLQLPRRSARSSAGRQSQPTVALFSFLAPPKPKANPAKTRELVDQLLELTVPTDGGLRATEAKREQIAEIVEELERFCPRNPLRSPLLYGDWDVVYTSKPGATGGPLRSPLGRAVFPGQRAVQRLQEPGTCINEVSYKTLGIVPGSARQVGEFTPINSDTFQLEFPNVGSKGGPFRRVIQIAYLDDQVRVARALPPEDAEDAEPSLFVFRRIVDAQQEEEEEAQAPSRSNVPFGGTRKIKAAVQEAQNDAPPARRSMLGTQLLGRRDGLATIAEKRFMAQQRSGSRGTGSTSRGGTGSTATVRKSRADVASERAMSRAAAEEERRAAREAAAAAKAAADEERRVRQAQLEAERARAAELKEAARQQLAQFQQEAAQAADEAKAATAAAKDAEKQASSLLQQASQARSLIEQAVSAVTAAVQQLEELKQQEKEAAGAVAEARNSLKELQRR